MVMANLWFSFYVPKSQAFAYDTNEKWLRSKTDNKCTILHFIYTETPITIRNVCTLDSTINVI